MQIHFTAISKMLIQSLPFLPQIFSEYLTYVRLSLLSKQISIVSPHLTLCKGSWRLTSIKMTYNGTSFTMG